MNALDQTLWIAHPDAYDYLHTLAFDCGRGFVIQGDGQAFNWASFFDYTIDDPNLTVTFIPTDGIVGDDTDDTIVVRFERKVGDFSVAHPMGSEPYKFTEVLDLSNPLVEYEPDSLRYYLCATAVDLSEIASGFTVKGDG